jgi:hypothetical protein
MSDTDIRKTLELLTDNQKIANNLLITSTEDVRKDIKVINELFEKIIKLSPYGSFDEYRRDLEVFKKQILDHTTREEEVLKIWEEVIILLEKETNPKISKIKLAFVIRTLLSEANIKSERHRFLKVLRVGGWFIGAPLILWMLGYIAINIGTIVKIANKLPELLEAINKLLGQ